jgi:hypothetical protein
MRNINKMPKIDDILAERGANYGSFKVNSKLSQSLKASVSKHPNWVNLPAYQKEAIEMILHKISRHVNGNPLYDDNFQDIQGYSKLALDIIRKENNQS